MAIEAVTASLLAKEIAGQSAVEATKQLAEKMAVESIESNQLTQSVEQTAKTGKFRIGEISSPEIEQKYDLETEEIKAARELDSKIDSSEIKEPFRDTGSDCLTTYEERFRQTPREGWDGQRGESICAKEIDPLGEVKVEYNNCIPDFSPYSIADVEIPNMSGERYGAEGNFEQADNALAEQFNKAGKDSRHDWTGAEVRDWRREKLSDYTWHECSDRKTCQLVPRDINIFFFHSWIIAECNKLAKLDGAFDFD